MGLLRIAAIVAVGVAVLPSDPDQQQRLYDRAANTAHWVVTFCDRNGPSCEKGSELWSKFVAKAEFGAKLAYEMAASQKAGDEDTTAKKIYSPAVLEGSGTLTPLDKKPAWRGKSQAKGSI
jgi:hypothetical protein